MNRRPLDVTLHHLKAVANGPNDEWSTNFARSVLRQAKNPMWQPTAKQLRVMERLVDEALGFDPHDDTQLIEEL